MGSNTHIYSTALLSVGALCGCLCGRGEGGWEEVVAAGESISSCLLSHQLLESGNLLFIGCDATFYATNLAHSLLLCVIL